MIAITRNDFFLSELVFYFLNLTFLMIGSHIVFIWTQQLSVAQQMCWFLKPSNSPDITISTRTTGFRFSSSLIFCGPQVSPLYTLPQLQRMEYI